MFLPLFYTSGKKVSEQVSSPVQPDEAGADTGAAALALLSLLKARLR